MGGRARTANMQVSVTTASTLGASLLQNAACSSMLPPALLPVATTAARPYTRVARLTEPTATLGEGEGGDAPRPASRQIQRVQVALLLTESTFHWTGTQRTAPSIQMRCTTLWQPQHSSSSDISAVCLCQLLSRCTEEQPRQPTLPSGHTHTHTHTHTQARARERDGGDTDESLEHRVVNLALRVVRCDHRRPAALW